MCLHSLAVWVDNVFMRGKEMSLHYESSAAQSSVLKWGTQRLYHTFVDAVAVFFVLWEVMGRGQVRGCSSEHPSSPARLSSSRLSRIHLTF